MSLKNEITQARINALKSNDKQTKTAVGYILAAIKQYEVDNKKEATDNDVLSIIKTLIRQRSENIAKYSNIAELVERDTAEINILSRYMPKQLSEDEVLSIIKSGIEKVKNSGSLLNSGLVIKEIKGELNGKTDMSKLKNLIEKELS